MRPVIVSGTLPILLEDEETVRYSNNHINPPIITNHHDHERQKIRTRAITMKDGNHSCRHRMKCLVKMHEKEITGHGQEEVLCFLLFYCFFQLLFSLSFRYFSPVFLVNPDT